MITKINNYFETLKYCLDKLDREEVNNFLSLLLNARNEEKNIFIMGNGGSASTASHFCCDCNKGIRNAKEKDFKMICLNDNIPMLLAYANDISYEDIFVGQLKNFLQEGDLVIGISSSGNSKNIIKAIEYANANGAITLGLTGYNGGLLKKCAQHSVNTNINDTQVSEDIHLMLCNMTYSILMNGFAANNSIKVAL